MRPVLRLPESKRDRIALLVVAVIGVTCVLGFVLDPARAAASYLTAYATVLGTVLATLLLIMIVELSGGTWFMAVKQQALIVVSGLPLLAILFLPIAAFAGYVFPWLGRHALASSVRDAIDKKSAYLAAGPAAIRAVIYWLVWIGVSEYLRAAIRNREERRDLESERRVRQLSAIGIILVALTMTFASFDWLMTMAPNWSASIYGLYFFAGASVAGVAVLAILTGLSTRHYHEADAGPYTLNSLGKLLLTFLLLWIYFGYSQFIVIWSGDLPREIPFYGLRARGGWAYVGLLLVAGHFFLPFLALIVRAVRRSPTTMIVIGAWLLVLHYLDIYWLAMPDVTRRLAPHWLDLSTLLTIAALCALAVVWRDRRQTATLAKA